MNTGYLKGEKRYGHLRVYGLDLKTTDKDIIQYLESKQFANVNCEKLVSRRPQEYSSFKLSFPLKDLEHINNSELWPEGVKLNHFFFKIGRKKNKE